MSWALLRTNPQSQERYMEYVGERYPHIELYTPMYERVARTSGARRATKVMGPVFPGYVFGRVEDDGDVQRLTSCPVVARFVRFGGVIGVVPVAEIERLRTMERTKTLVKETKHAVPFAIGAKVHIQLPCGGIFGSVVGYELYNRILVSTPICCIRVPVDRVVQA